jgi:hypothetical protein
MVFVGCGSSGEPLSIPEGCNPLAADWDCTLPFPSDFFLEDDPGLPSGQRVVMARRAMVQSQQDQRPVDPFGVHPADGFSHLPPILALFPGGVDASDLVFHSDDISRTLAGESPTVLIDAETLQPVPHFAEMDPRAESDERRALVIRPLVRLINQRRYLVAISGLHDPQGELIQPPEGFRRLRDKEAEGAPALEDLAGHYEDSIFPRLELAGIGREELQLTWDFTTESQEHVSADMLAVREQAIEWLQNNQPQVWVDLVSDDVSANLARQVEGRFEVPLYLEEDEPGARLHRDGTGRVSQNGTGETRFVLIVPRSVAERTASDPEARLVQFGHGLFESREKIKEERLVEMADQSGWVLLSADFEGMSTADLSTLVYDLMYEPDQTTAFTDRVHQAMANQIVLAAAAQGPLLDLAELQIGPGRLYDPDHIYFWAVSMGHLLGSTYVTLSPLVDRAALCTGGAGFTLIMFRSVPFAPFLGLIEDFAPDPLDMQKFAAQLQTTLDRIDSVTYAPHTLSGTYPGGPAERRVLMEMAVSDSEVPNLATHLHARVLGIGLLQPSPVEVFGLPAETAPAASALVAHDFGIDPETVSLAQPPESTNGVHTEVSRLEATRRQIDAFFQPDGSIEHTCEGICDPE